MIKLILLSIALLIFASDSNAQVRQSGTVTSRHVTCWTTNGTVQDCGTAALPIASSFGTWGQGPTICANSDNPATAVGWNRLCIGASTAAAAQISLQNFGTAAAQGLQFNINGNIVELPSVGGNFATFAGTPLIGNPSCWSNVSGQLTNCDRITNVQLATAGAATLKGNPTALQADVQDFPIQGLVQKNSPDATADFLVLYDSVAGSLKKVTPGSIATAATAGVSSLNGLTGGLTLGALNVTATGATTAITEANRAARTVYVTDFGALCDGTTNDRAAIQAAIDAMAATGGIVYLPTGTCAIATGITLASGITLQGQGLGQNNYTPYVSRIKWIGGATGSIIATPVADSPHIAIRDMVIDGNVPGVNTAASALKAIQLRTGRNTLIQNVIVQNVGKGLSMEPNFAASGLIALSAFRDIFFLSIGTAIELSPNFVIGNVAGGTTNNVFENIMIFEYSVLGINFVGLADDNKFNGVYIQSATPGAGASVVFNSGNPTTSAGVYANSMLNTEIECAGPVHDSVIVNNTQGFGSTFQGMIFTCNPVVVNGGGVIDIQDTNSLFGFKSVRTSDASSGLVIKNTSGGASANARMQFGNNTNDDSFSIQINGGGNSTFGGVNTVNMVNTAAVSTNMYVNGLRASFGSAGNSFVGTLTLSNSIGNANGTNPMCYNATNGAVTFATTACTASDAALKRNFTPITNALGLIKNVEGGYYYWKDAARGTGRQIGLIANAAESAMPELVSKDDAGIRAFDYQHFTAVLLQAVKELKAEVDTLKRSRRVEAPRKRSRLN